MENREITSYQRGRGRCMNREKWESRSFDMARHVKYVPPGWSACLA